jgi:hypothetical protein
VGLSSTIALTFTAFSVVSAVSADEKKPDNIKSIARITSSMTPEVSKKNHSLK